MSEYDLSGLPSDLLTSTREGDRWLKVSPNKNALGTDAWDRNKVIIDYSIFHGLFTFNVPDEMWIEEVDGVEQVKINFTSLSGALNCVGIDGQTNLLYSKRNPRYQPNRGHLYSSSMIIDTCDLAVDHDFGIFTETSGLFFRVNSGLIYAVRRTTVAGITTDNQTLIAADLDLTKGNVFDIQAMWRGVGDVGFMINLKVVAELKLLGTLDDLSVNNPALPISFSMSGLGQMRCGCVDVSSEGGAKDSRQRGFVDTGEISLAATETPVLLLQLQKTVTYEIQQVRNTRDIALRKVSAFADDNTIIKVYYTRDSAKFAGTIFTDYDATAAIKFSTDGDIVLDDLTTNINRIETSRVAANDSISLTNPDDEFGDFYLTAGDNILITAQAKNQTTGGVSVVWGAEI